MAETLATLKARYRWDNRVQRWRGPGGSYVSQKALTADLRRFASNAGRAMRTLTRRMLAGDMTLAGWQEAMADRIKSLHLSQAAAASGGFSRLTQADYGRLGGRLRFHYRALQDFADKVAAGRLSDAHALARTDLYGAAGNVTYQNTRLEQARTRFREARRVLGRSEHCSGCIREAARGWVPIETLKPWGLEPCRMRCKCVARFRFPR